MPADMQQVIEALAVDADQHWQETEFDEFAGYIDLDGGDGD
jgi:hypothetical protein